MVRYVNPAGLQGKSTALERHTDFNWDAYKSRNEKILWEGRPQGFPRLSLPDALSSAFASIFIFSGLFVIFGATPNASGAWPMVLLIGLAHFGVGFYISIGRHIQRYFKLKSTHYAITESRVLIATRNKLESLQLRNVSSIDIEHGKHVNIIFNMLGEKPKFSFFLKRGSMPVLKPGLYAIDDGAAAYQILTDAMEAIR